MESMTLVQIMHKSICVSLPTNSLGKMMKTFVLTSTLSKIEKHNVIFSLSKVTSPEGEIIISVHHLKIDQVSISAHSKGFA